MSRDKEYDIYCKKANIENKNTPTDTLGSIAPISPIRSAVELLDLRITQLQAVTERLFMSLKPVTSNTDDNFPREPSTAREGNSVLTIDLNATAERIGVITTALQLQLDRLEV